MKGHNINTVPDKQIRRGIYQTKAPAQRQAWLRSDLTGKESTSYWETSRPTKLQDQTRFQHSSSQLTFYVNLHRAVIGPSATLTGRWRPDIELRRMLTGLKAAADELARSLAILFQLSLDQSEILSDWRDPVSILRKSISGRHRPVRVADGPMTARCRFT